MNGNQMEAAAALVAARPTLRMHEQGLVLHESRHGIARLDGDAWVATRNGSYLRAFGSVRRFPTLSEACAALGWN